jgi:hypothetical protein
MTKKDFELIAGALLRSRPLPIGNLVQDAQRTSVADMTARNMADALATTNPKFNRAKFLAACGVAS